MGFTGGTSGKEPICQGRRCRKWGIDPWVGKIPCRRAWQPTPLFLPRESHGQRSLVGYGPYGCKESYTLSDWTEAPCTVVYKVKVQTTTVSKKVHILIKKMLFAEKCKLSSENAMQYNEVCLYICRSGIARSYGKPMFNHSRNHQNVIQSSCTILLSHQQRMG